MRRSRLRRKSPILAWVCAVAALAPALVPPASAGAAVGASFQQELVAPPTETTATAKKTTTTEQESSSSSGLSPTLIFALVAGGVLLAGIAFVIVRDARSVAPVTEGAAAGGTRNPEARLRKRRARAKAARQQRKKNR
jgi:hypothetical protein